LDRPADTHRAAVLAVAVAADGSVLSLGRDNVLRRWDPETGRQTAQSPLNPGDAPGQVILTPDGTIASPQCVSADGRFRADADSGAVVVTDLKTRQTVATLPAGPCGWWSGPTAAAFSPDGRLLATTAEGQVRLWATGSWQPRGSLPQGVSGMAFSPDGRMLVTTDLNDVTVWEVGTRLVRFSHRPGLQLPASARFSPDGRFVAWVMRTGAVEVWDVTRGRAVAAFKGHDGGLQGYAFTPDGGRIVTASDDCTLLVWDAAGAAARAGDPPPAGEKKLRAAWDELASADAGKAFAAVQALAAAPDVLVRLARAGVRPAAPVDKVAVERYLADLGSEDFETRERATERLKGLGERVEKAVIAFRAATESPEAARRADEVLTAVRSPVGAARLLALRSVEALERAGAPSARELLRELSKGDPDAELTREATAAARRLGSGK
jgi:sugar lactone lactonase YvrE